MKALTIIMLLVSCYTAHAGIKIKIKIPTPTNPIPGCNSCACGNAGKCAEDAARALRIKEAEEAARRAQDAERKAGEAVTQAAEQKVKAAVGEAKTLVADLEKKASAVVQLAENEFDRQKTLLEANIRAIESAVKNPNFIEGLIDAGNKIVAARIEVERARFMDALNFILKNNIKNQVREKQVLVIVSELAEAADPRYKSLYKFIQSAGIPMAQGKLTEWYDQIIVLEKSQATKQNLLRVLAEQSGREKIKAVDLFVFLHGSPGSMAFFDDTVETVELGREIAAINSQGKLRMVYNTSCYGASHIQDFLSAGFKVASGAQAINSNAGTEYPAFLELLSLGQPFGVAISMSNDPKANATWDAMISLNGMSPANSNKSIGGDPTQGYLLSAAKWVVESLIKL